MDSTIDTELKKNGITVVCPINQQYVNQIAYYVATTLVTNKNGVVLIKKLLL